MTSGTCDRSFRRPHCVPALTMTSFHCVPDMGVFRKVYKQYSVQVLTYSLFSIVLCLMSYGSHTVHTFRIMQIWNDMSMGYFCSENMGKHCLGLFQQLHEFMALFNTILSIYNKSVMCQFFWPGLKDTWQVTSDKWQVTSDKWLVTSDKWLLTTDCCIGFCIKNEHHLYK